MRTSSMKSRTAITIIALTLSLAVSRAEAKPAQQKENRGVIATICQLYKHYLRVVATGDLPSDPWPVANVPHVATPETTDPTAPKGSLR